MTTSFTNWSENLDTDQTIIYPTTDNGISNLIRQCRDRQLHLRVVGSGHSISPLVLDNRENDVILVSLEKYKFTPEDITFFLDEAFVRVNAGWTLGQLYDYLDKHNCVLPTQPASSAFTIGGIISLPVHGSRLGRSFIAESVVALTLIDQDGEVRTKNTEDEDFWLYCYGMGMMGIITSVTFRLEKYYNTLSSIQTHETVFSGNKVDRTVLDPVFTRLVEECLAAESKGYYHHSFIDFHNNRLLCLDWHIENNPSFSASKIDRRESRSVYKVRLAKFFHTYIFSSYRRHPWYLRLLGNISKWLITSATRLDSIDDRNMLWFSVGSAAYFMEYFIPIQCIGKPICLDRLYKALEILKEEAEATRGSDFVIDLPISLRLITSDTYHHLSPLYSDEKQVYIAIDVVCGVANLSLDSTSIRSGYQNLNQVFRSFCSRVEQRWQEMGGIPHLGKMSGFSNGQDPFTDIETVRKGLNPELMRLLRLKSSPVFRNSYLERLLSTYDPEDL